MRRRKADMNHLGDVFDFLSKKSKNPRVILIMKLKLFITDVSVSLYDNRKLCASVGVITHQEIKTGGG